jgi:FHS family Na+ dependent glucose MFS transporter 1
MAQGTIDLGGNALLIWVHRAKVGPFMNGLHFAFGVGAFLAPIVVAQAVRASGQITWAYWILAATALPAALWIARLPSPANPAHERKEEAGREDYALVALITLFFALYVGAEVGFGSWIFSYARALNLADTAAAAYLTSAYYGTYTLGRLLAIPIAVRLAPRTIMGGSLLAALVAMTLVLAGASSPLATWAGTLGLGLAMAAVFPTMFSLAERHMHISGKVSGWFFFGGSAGGMTLPWLIGQLFDRLGPRMAMAAVLVDLVLATAVFALVIVAVARRRVGNGK